MLVTTERMLTVLAQGSVLAGASYVAEEVHETLEMLLQNILVVIDSSSIAITVSNARATKHQRSLTMAACLAASLVDNPGAHANNEVPRYLDSLLAMPR